MRTRAAGRGARTLAAQAPPPAGRVAGCRVATCHLRGEGNAALGSAAAVTRSPEGLRARGEKAGGSRRAGGAGTGGGGWGAASRPDALWIVEGLERARRALENAHGNIKTAGEKRRHEP